MTKKLNPLSFSAELLQKVLLNILYQVKAHYKCMYIIRERDRVSFCGKKNSISIWMKTMYIQIFRTLQDDPSVRYPYAAFFKEPQPGCYYGCFTKNDGTGWIDRAQADHWELFVKHCDKMSRRYSEVPNWARQLLSLEKVKGKSPGRTIPLIVEAAVEELSMTAIKDCQEVQGARHSCD